LPKRPKWLTGDRGYDAQWLRDALRERHIQAAIPRRKSSSGQSRRKLTQQAQQHFGHRWQVERGIGWFDGFRRLVVRWERHWQLYEAFHTLALIIILLRRF
jgi:transposase